MDIVTIKLFVAFVIGVLKIAFIGVAICSVKWPVAVPVEPADIECVPLLLTGNYRSRCKHSRLSLVCAIISICNQRYHPFLAALHAECFNAHRQTIEHSHRAPPTVSGMLVLGKYICAQRRECSRCIPSWLQSRWGERKSGWTRRAGRSRWGWRKRRFGWVLRVI